MKLLIVSDLHLRRGETLELPAEFCFDISVIAGDVLEQGHRAVAWAQGAAGIRDRPCVFVPGNHEFYGSKSFDFEMASMLRLAEGSNVHVLNRSSVVIGGVRFMGCMLWTDFQLPVAAEGGRETNVSRSLRAANLQMADYEGIQILAPSIRAGRHREFARCLRAEDTLAMHWVDRDWLRRELQKPFAGPTVVVTHHAPSSRSVAAQYDGDALSPAFASDLPDAFFGVPSLWIHGHTHTSADYLRGGCRVVSNPRGYPVQGLGFENPSFNPALVVEVPWPPQPEDADFERATTQMRHRAREAIFLGARWLSVADLTSGRLIADDSAHPDSLGRWLDAGRIFAIEMDGALRVPAYALDSRGEPAEALKPILEALEGLDSFQVAAFFESPSSWLDGKRPREVLHDAGAAVLYAAQVRASGPLHG